MGYVSSNLLNHDEEFAQLGSSALGHDIISLTSTIYGLLTLDPPRTPSTTPPFCFTLSSLWSEPKPLCSEPEVINSWELMIASASLPSLHPNPSHTTTLRGVKRTFEACNAVRAAFEAFGRKGARNHKPDQKPPERVTTTLLLWGSFTTQRNKGKEKTRPWRLQPRTEAMQRSLAVHSEDGAAGSSTGRLAGEETNTQAARGAATVAGMRGWARFGAAEEDDAKQRRVVVAGSEGDGDFLARAWRNNDCSEWLHIANQRERCLWGGLTEER
ncbi:hypothetical protein SESBI_02993 [Sesbania bispinosa]|nr:hypothetical protein SESBI_02993 [Sesbania bispinosa]